MKHRDREHLLKDHLKQNEERTVGSTFPEVWVAQSNEIAKFCDNRTR
jgi:hypothetical protein